MQTKTYERKPFKVDGVQVTDENIHEVAEWAGGTLERDDKEKPFIKVKVQRALNERQTQAFVGDWVLKSSNGFKVFTEKAFRNSFQAA